MDVGRHREWLLLRLVVERRLQASTARTSLAHLRVVDLPAGPRLRLGGLGGHATLLAHGGGWRGRDNGATVHPVERYE